MGKPLSMLLKTGKFWHTKPALLWTTKGRNYTISTVLKKKMEWHFTAHRTKKNYILYKDLTEHWKAIWTSSNLQ